MFFNSLDKMYKSVFGAVKVNQEICYRVYAPDYEAAFLLFRQDGQEEYQWTPMQKDAYGWYTADKSFSDPGVYFYHFMLRRDFQDAPVYRNADGWGTFEGQTDWQQTVFEAQYQTPDWLKGGMIYQIFPDRFYKAPAQLPRVFPERVEADWNDAPAYQNGTTGRVINNDYFGGNLKGIMEKLPYLQSLGVTAIYLNPIFEAHSNHRYNVADYLHVDPMLGTDADFKALCDAAGQAGIRIILDGVFSHTGSDSIYFNKNGRYDSTGAYQSQQSPYFSWYTFQNFPDTYSSWWGFDTLPETNETDPSFLAFITGEGGVIDTWMKMGASGFRLDVADELPDAFIEAARTAVKRVNPDGVLYGEVWEDASNKISYGVRRRYLYGKELDSVMNYPFANLIVDFVKGFGGVQFINGVMEILEHYPKPAVDMLMNLLGTHDTERIITLLAGEPAGNRGREWQHSTKMNEKQLEFGTQLLKLATAAQFTLPGVPCVYYGDEILTEGYRDPFNRTAFRWEKAVSGNPVLYWYQFLGKLRRACPALDGGDFIPVQYEQNFASYLRVKGKDELFTVINPSNVTAAIWLLPGWKDDVVLLGDKPVDGILYVPPKSVAFMGRGDWAKAFDA